jgi:small ligand-binding sensory domain FIST
MTSSPANPGLQFASALSTNEDTDQAIAEVCSQASGQLGGPADLAVLFVSHHHGPDFAPLLDEIQQRITPRRLIGCTGESIVGTATEVEDSPAVSLWLARLPGVSLVPMHLEFERTPEGGTFVGWPDDLPEPWPAGATLLLLGEPFSFPADYLLERLAEDHPELPILGGMASGAASPGANRLFLDGEAFESGAAALLVHGPVRIRSVVSQGCRPIGRPMVVTKADQQVILELSGKPPLAQLQEVFDDLPPREQQLVQQGLHVGRVINEYQEHFGRGDFLVRNCIGADRKSGAIAIGDFVRTGQTVQFHVRDAQSADDDLRELLKTLGQGDASGPAGALLFTCNGRGTRMFREPHHDAAALVEQLGKIPVAGFFAQGEIGPVGGKNFLHGFTASVALFGPA